MNIEAGKTYKTRDGQKAFVAGISPFMSTDEYYRLAGFIDGSAKVFGWTATGRYAMNSDSEEDLVAEWVEPPTPLEVCQCIDRLANEPDAKISWPYLSQIVTMAREAIAASK